MHVLTLFPQILHCITDRFTCVDNPEHFIVCEVTTLDDLNAEIQIYDMSWSDEALWNDDKNDFGIHMQGAYKLLSILHWMMLGIGHEFVYGGQINLMCQHKIHHHFGNMHGMSNLKFWQYWQKILTIW